MYEMTSPRPLTPQLRERLQCIKAFLLDVDGVLTKNISSISPAEFEAKTIIVMDEFGIRSAQKRGIRIGIITGGNSTSISTRARELDIHDLYEGALNKLEPYEHFKSLHGLTDEEIAYIGDGILDLPVLRKVGFSATPLNAHPSVKIAVHYVASRAGGYGAVREVLDLLLQAKEIPNVG